MLKLLTNKGWKNVQAKDIIKQTFCLLYTTIYVVQVERKTLVLIG